MKHKYRLPEPTTWKWGWKMDWCRINGLACANNANWNLAEQAWNELDPTEPIR